jgi:hypothetical protein
VLLACFATFVATNATNHKSDAEAVGFVIGTLIPVLGLPLLVAFLAALRKPPRKPRFFAYVFCGMTLLFSLMTISGNLRGIAPETPEQMAGRLMREAAGRQPVRNALFPQQRRMDDALRSAFKKVVQANKDYTQRLAALDLSAVKELNSAHSFVDLETGELALSQIHAAYELDIQQEQTIEKVLAELHDLMPSLASSKSDLQKLEQGFSNAMSQIQKERSGAVNAEKAWIDSLDEEYSYVREHRSSLREENGRLIIAGHELLLEFNRRMDHQEEMRKQFVQKQDALQNSQKQRMQKMGISPQDVGAK